MVVPLAWLLFAWLHLWTVVFQSVIVELYDASNLMTVVVGVAFLAYCYREVEQRSSDIR